MADKATETSGVKQGRAPSDVEQAAAQNEAKAQIEREARQETQALREETVEVASADVDADPTTSDQLDGGTISVRYLGTSDRALVGTNEDGTEVYAYAGGDPVKVTRERADQLLSLTHDKFEETK